MYNTSKYFSYIYADRNVRPCTIQGYTLTTFPNITQYIYAQPEKQAKELCILNSCTLLVIFLSLSLSLLHNCSCKAFCNSLNLSSSMPSSSGSSGRPLNMNSNIPISSMPIYLFALFLLPFLCLLR